MAGALGGRIALVTGAGTGIGRAVCNLFAKEGASVVGIGLQDTAVTISELPKISNDVNHLSFDADVTSEANIQNFMDKILQEYNRPPTIAVNCAGITRDSFLIRMSEKDFDDVMDTNLKGTFFITKHLCSALVKSKEKNASIINISSIVGKTGNIGQANYTASKAGVIGLTKTTALEFARYGIRCNAILPGFIKTPMTDKVPDKVSQAVKALIPLRSFGQPEDIAEACLFLSSDRSRYITGTTLEVTGGLAA